MGELLKRITAGLLAKAIWELGAWLFLGGSVLAIWAYWDDFLEQPIPLQLLAVASVIVLVVVAVTSARQALELLDTSPAKIWYKLKWWGIAWHAYRFFNVQGHIDDPRFGWVIVHVKNNTSKAVPNVAGHLEHYLNSNHQLQARVNLNGQMLAAGQLQAMPPKSEIRFMVPFAETNDHQQMPRVEVGLRDWPSFDFVGTVGTTEIRQHFSIETFRSEVNRVLGQYRNMQVAHAAQQFPVGNAQA